MKNDIKCRDCSCCKRLYRRYECEFWADKFYYCTLRQELVVREDRCENFVRKEVKYDISNERFDKAQADILFLIERLVATDKQ